jgi:hypothetical protein
VDSNGNHVIVGNCDPQGVNVNNNWNDNRNSNIGVGASRKSPLCLVMMNARLMAGIHLPIPRGFDPAAEHAANFINRRLKR